MPDLERTLRDLSRRAPFPPTPLADIARRAAVLRRRDRRRRAGIAGGVVATVALAAVLLSQALPDHHTVVVTTPSPAVVTGLGRVAYVAGGQLYLRDGSGRPTVVAGAATASDPAWSSDGTWLAFLRTPPAPASQPYATEPSALWVVRADGEDPRRVTGPDADVESFAWDPAGDVLAVLSSSTSSPSAGSEITIASPTSGGTSVLVPPEPAVVDFAWDPSGQALAVGTYAASSDGERGSVELVPLHGGPTTDVYNSAGSALDVAGWWPDGRGLLFWSDPQDSGSLAADGLPLYSLDLADGRASPLGDTLVHQDFLAWSPSGTKLALAIGDDRSIWDGGKHVEICTIPSGSCHAVAVPAQTVALDPAWTPGGDLLFTQAPASSYPGFPASFVEKWYGDQTLWEVPASGGPPRRVPGPGTGAHAPTATAGGMVYIERDQLWFLPAGSTTPVEVAASLGPADPYGSSYYGYIDWASTYAWAP